MIIDLILQTMHSVFKYEVCLCSVLVYRKGDLVDECGSSNSDNTVKKIVFFISCCLIWHWKVEGGSQLDSEKNSTSKWEYF